MTVYPESEWRELMAAHEERADERLAKFRHPGGYHPVYDFLFEYYPVRPTHLRRWHPGFGVKLDGKPPHRQWRDYCQGDNGLTELDLPAFWLRRGESIMRMRTLMTRTALNPATFDCFGLHEWAMVYKIDSPRHKLPLRLGLEGTNAVVESNRFKCTHFDAYRFFSTPALPLNLTVLTRNTQPDFEQTGCVHATMDLYKWAWKLGSLIPGEVFLDALDLAIAARTLDMEASPYDCRGLGFSVVAIETTEGKAEYVRRQRELAKRAEPLREKLIAFINSAAEAVDKPQARST